MTDQCRLSLHADLSEEFSEEDIDNGLPQLRAMLARLPIQTFDIERENMSLSVSATFSDEQDGDSIVDQIIEAIGDVFPSEPGPPPIEFFDPILGRLIYHDEYSWFQGSFQMSDANDPIRLYIDSEPDSPCQASLVRAKQIVEQWSKARSRIYAAIASSLLDLYNDEWRKSDEKDEGPLDADRFCARLSVDSLSLDSQQVVTLRFGADGMFTEHGVTISIAANDEVEAWIE